MWHFWHFGTFTTPNAIQSAIVPKVPRKKNEHAMSENRFILQPYKGRATRHVCPSCHQKQCFTRYIDTEGRISFPDDVGRCDHENNCGYHYTPKQFFHDHPEAKTQFFETAESANSATHCKAKG